MTSLRNRLGTVLPTDLAAYLLAAALYGALLALGFRLI